jgi:phenylalanyl-tRNA synthetase beta chain
VFLESAFFPPESVTDTGRALQIDTDARYRFEREVDKAFVVPGADIATGLIVEYCGGTASTYSFTGNSTISERVIAFNASKVETLGGILLEEKYIYDILTKLGFKISGNQVSIPSWRNDVNGEADLVEEVLRVHGYDALPATPLPLPSGFTPALSAGQQRVATTRTLLAARGFTEAVTWSFMPTPAATLFGGGQPALRLQNPISSELESMSPSLLPNLLDALKRNSARGYHDLALFETGPVFHGIGADQQPLVVSAIRSGHTAPKNPHHEARLVDVLDSKADILTLLEEYGMAPDKLSITRDAPDWYHPGRSGTLRLGNKALGVFGELHPAILAKYDIKTPVAGFELFIQSVPFSKPKHGRKPAPDYSDYQAVQRDFAFIVANDILAEQVLKAVKGAEKELITQVSLFDVYSGKGVEDGHKSLALTITLQAKDRTLTEDEIETVSKKVIESVGKHTQAVLRG